MNIDKQDVISKLHQSVCKVVFTKANGDNRILHCTLQESMLPAQVDLEEQIQKKKPNPDVLAVWDVEAKGWRSFRWDSVKEFKTEFNV
jgi:hypothetical protein